MEGMEQQLLHFISAKAGVAGASRIQSALVACHRAEIETVAELQELARAGNLATVGFSPLTAQRVAAAFAPKDFASLLPWLPERASHGSSCLSKIANTLSNKELMQVFEEQGATSLVDRCAYLAMVTDDRRAKFGLPAAAAPPLVAGCLAAEAAWQVARADCGERRVLPLQFALHRLAFAGVVHSRLAEASPAGQLPVDIVHRVGHSTSEEHVLPDRSSSTPHSRHHPPHRRPNP
jgi:hypothetical protein